METLIFDCDGVLVDSESIAEAVIIQRLGEWLPDIQPAAMLRQALGMTTAAILEHIEQRSAHALPSDALLRIENAIEECLERDLQAIEGVLEAVAELHLPLAIVSNSSRRRVQVSLASTGLSSTLLGEAPLFTAEQVENPKPAPDVYRLAARSLNCEPRDCLVVEDSVSGVTAARAAGMTVIGFTGASHIEPGHGERLKRVGAWQILSRMQELDVLIQRWRESRSLADESQRSS